MTRIVITDANCHLYADPKAVGFEMGCIQRDYAAMPFGSLPFAGGWDMTEMSDEEIRDGIADQDRNKSSLEHIRADCGIRSLDQDGYGYCWAFSTVKAVMLVRAAQNEPTVELSGWAIGALVKNYRNQGGWCQQSLDKIVELGCPSFALFPKADRRYDTPEMRADAATRKVTEWMDMEGGNTRQLASNLLRNIPTMVDGAMPGHSVCALRLLSWKPLRYLIDNSWTPTWSDDGMAEITRAPQNMACPRVSLGG